MTILDVHVHIDISVLASRILYFALRHFSCPAQSFLCPKLHSAAIFVVIEGKDSFTNSEYGGWQESSMVINLIRKVIFSGLVSHNIIEHASWSSNWIYNSKGYGSYLNIQAQLILEVPRVLNIRAVKHGKYTCICTRWYIFFLRYYEFPSPPATFGMKLGQLIIKHIKH